MSTEKKEQIQYLLLQYLDGKATEKQEALLFSMLEQEQDNSEWEPLIEELIAAEPEFSDYRREDWQPVLQKILTPGSGKVVDINIRKPKIGWRIAVAASIILLLGIGAYFMLFNRSTKPTEIVKTPTEANDVKAPEANRAMIVLANGQQVYLDSANSGELAMQGNVKLVKLADGQISYSGNATEVTFNTLTNPRGSKVIDMTLADGSHVWLNAGSSVTYPVAFVGNERKVSITGEAYFEVTHDVAKPFIVSKGETSVQVLGTHFNVNAYDDEDNIKVTLLEGSVKTSIGNSQSVVLKAGQQSQVSSIIKVVNDANLDEVMAWKNGKFIFGANADIQTIMRQIARWYDVNVVYDGAVPKQRFGGEMPRTTNLSQVMEILKTSGVKFTIEGRKVTIRP